MPCSPPCKFGHKIIEKLKGGETPDGVIWNPHHTWRYREIAREESHKRGRVEERCHQSQLG